MKPADRFGSVLWAVVIVVALIGLGMFVATSRFTGLTAREFFGTAFWIGFALSLIAREAWIYWTAGQKNPTVQSGGGGP